MKTSTSLKPRGFIRAELWRGGRLVRELLGRNAVVTEGKNKLLEVHFHADTPVTTWYIGLINATPTPTLLDADSLASHTGWVEFTNYTGNRQAWSPAAASAGSMGSASTSDFPILGTASIFGIFVCSVASGSSGTIWATGGFDEEAPVVNTDTLKITYVTDQNG